MKLYVILSIVTLALPFVVSIFLARTNRIPKQNLFLFLAIGAGGWIVAKIPKGLVILPFMLARGMPLQMEPAQFEKLLRTDLLFLVVAAVSAGVFEEVCKPLGLLLVKSRISLANAAATGWIVGIGAGLLESLNFLGGTAYRIVGPEQAAISEVLHVPVERLFITFFHGALTAIVVFMVMRRRYWVGLGVPILIHFAIDLAMPYAQVHGIISDTWRVQGVIVVWVVLTCLLSARMTRLNSGRESGPV